MRRKTTFGSRMDKMEKIFWIFFSVVVVLIVAGIGFSIWATIEIVQAVQADGLKSVVEVLWNGAQQSSEL
ncbi:hypothetical protein M8756_18620 [Lutimaribacter sp. EGI FJ00015]|nr:hypothetical protein [Lutimaribacter sp. EGI FJ00015]URQ04075.1 hypothetical protein vBEclMUFV01_107 [Enterobacter phage vB_EclM-UFV01]